MGGSAYCTADLVNPLPAHVVYTEDTGVALKQFYAAHKLPSRFIQSYK